METNKTALATLQALSEQEQKPVVQEPTKITPPSTAPQSKPKESKEVSIAANCDALSDKLNSCTKYKCQFVHPFTGETMQREIVGIVGGKCSYVEQMPNNGELKCDYTPSQRGALEQYYRDLKSAETAGATMSTDLLSGELLINGKKVENLLQTFIEDGTCTISGY